MRTEYVLYLRRASVIVSGAALAGCPSFVSLGASDLSDGSTSDSGCLAEIGCDGSVPSGGDVFVPETGASDAMSPCDPLAPLPTKLGVLLGVGQDSSGTLYVADTAPDGQNRVFVSDGNTLYRQHVLGTGQSGTTQYSFTFESADSDGSDARDLLLNATGGQATAMALAPPVGKLFLTPGAPGMTSLTLVDAGAVDGMNVVNLPGTVAYFGDVSNGNVIILTVAMDAYSSADYRLYYGPSNDVVEYAITTFGQALSGYPQVTFAVGSSVYTMQILSTQGATTLCTETGPCGSLGPGTLSIAGGATLAFTLRSPAPTSLAGLTFTCLSPSSASWTQPVEAAALLGALVTPCPVGYAHPSVCCQGALNQQPVCTESPDAPFQSCAVTSLTYPDPNKCCSLATDTGCIAPDSDAAVPVEGEASVSDCFYQCGPGGSPVALLPADSGLSGEPSCASLDNPWSGSQGACVWCCYEQGGCPTNSFSCPANGCSGKPPGSVCDPCPSGWQTPPGGQYDLCCETNSQGGTDCFSVANSISPN